MPDFELENEIGGLVCGLDEVGRGPLAGPVVAACVFIPPLVQSSSFVDHIQDSKKLSKPKLLELYGLITAHCSVGIGQCSAAEIGEINILQASLEAMRRAYVSFRLKRSDMEESDDMGGRSLDFARDDSGERWHALVDGNKVPRMPCPATAVVKGDSKSVSIAAASIVAKVTRDRYMAKLAEEFPHYGWERNAAYPSPEHLAALKTHGATPHHRRSFAPVRAAVSSK